MKAEVMQIRKYFDIVRRFPQAPRFRKGGGQAAGGLGKLVGCEPSVL